MRGPPYSLTQRRKGRWDRGSTMAEAIVALVLLSILLVLALRLTSAVSTSQGRRNISETLEQITSDYLAEARLADCARYYATATPDPNHPCAVPLNHHMSRMCDAAEAADKPVSVSYRVCLDADAHSGAVVDVWDLYRPPTWCTSGYTTPQCVPAPTRIVVAAHPGRLHIIERATVGRSARRVDPFWGRLTCSPADDGIKSANRHRERHRSYVEDRGQRRRGVRRRRRPRPTRRRWRGQRGDGLSNRRDGWVRHQRGRLVLTAARHRARGGRCDAGETFASVIVAMIITGLVMPAVLHMVYVTAQVAAVQPTPDPAVAAYAQLQSLLGEADPVGVCATPVGSGRRDQCQTLHDTTGVSLVSPPGDALAVDPLAVCWLARPDNPDTVAAESGLKALCLMLRDDGHDDPFNGPEVVAPDDVLQSHIDPDGGDELIVRSYDTAVPAAASSTDTEDFLLPAVTTASAGWADRVVYFDAEWWCLRWRHPKHAGVDAAVVGPWRGACPCPTDTFEQIPLTATVTEMVASATPIWADTDSLATPPPATPDDGDPFDSIAALSGDTGACERVHQTTVTDYCNAAVPAGNMLPGVPILTSAPTSSCANDAWWNPRYATEATPGVTGALREFLRPPAAIVGTGDSPPTVLSRVVSIEITVCAATLPEVRIRGGDHCRPHVMRFSLER